MFDYAYSYDENDYNQQFKNCLLAGLIYWIILLILITSVSSLSIINPYININTGGPDRSPISLPYNILCASHCANSSRSCSIYLAHNRCNNTYHRLAPVCQIDVDSTCYNITTPYYILLLAAFLGIIVTISCTVIYAIMLYRYLINSRTPSPISEYSLFTIKPPLCSKKHACLFILSIVTITVYVALIVSARYQ